jgi:hypothetical protein
MATLILLVLIGLCFGWAAVGKFVGFCFKTAAFVLVGCLTAYLVFVVGIVVLGLV